MSNNHQVDLPVVDDIGYQQVAGYSAAVSTRPPNLFG
jgi:hypothetical protein